jgi:hypothetical protein
MNIPVTAFQSSLLRDHKAYQILHSAPLCSTFSTILIFLIKIGNDNLRKVLEFLDQKYGPAGRSRETNAYIQPLSDGICPAVTKSVTTQQEQRYSDKKRTTRQKDPAGNT